MPVLALLAALLGCAGCGQQATAPSRTPAADSPRPAWRPQPPALLARTEVAAARIGGSIYVAGGFVAAGGGRNTAAVERYAIRRRRWSRVASMPRALNHAAAVAYRGRLFVLGGFTAPHALTGETNVFLAYDPRRDRWTRMPLAPSRRAALAAGVIGGRLYAAGGVRHRRALRALEIFDFRRRRWSRGPSMGIAREHLAGASAGGAFYVLAGRVRGRGNLRVAERFVPARRRWERLAPLGQARGGIAAATVDRRIVVFGGEAPGGTIASAELYDPARRRWRFLAPLSVPRHGLGGAALGSRVFALEGGPRPGFSFAPTLEELTVR